MLLNWTLILQVWCKLRYNGHYELLVGACYRTPTETVYGHIAHEQLRALFQEVSNRDFILMGDFNYKGIDWINNFCNNSSVDSRLFLECANKCFVTQQVTDLTPCSISLVGIQLWLITFTPAITSILSCNLNIAKEA